MGSHKTTTTRTHSTWCRVAVKMIVWLPSGISSRQMKSSTAAFSSDRTEKNARRRFGLTCHACHGANNNNDNDDDDDDNDNANTKQIIINQKARMSRVGTTTTTRRRTHTEIQQTHTHARARAHTHTHTSAHTRPTK